jgi:hypothetical protein
MAEEKRYKAKIDYEDGSATGVHEESFGTLSTVKQAVRNRLTAAHFDRQRDGSYLIYRSESQAGNPDNVVGSIVQWDPSGLY